MFAYNPTTNQQTCGISSNATLRNMTLVATTSIQSIKSTEMHYLEGIPSVREYDACYYVIVTPQDDCPSNFCINHDSDDGVRSILFRLNKAENIDVYFWEGNGRENAKKAMQTHNDPPKVGEIYDVGMKSGFLIVTVPRKDMKFTSLDFDYWLNNTYVKSSAASVGVKIILLISLAAHIY